MIKLSDYIVSFLEKKGLKHIFMLVGGGSMHLNNSIGESKNIEYICNLNEQSVAISAEAYSKYNQNFGVAMVTSGPGSTNTITGVSSAWCDSVPVLFISGQVKKEDLIGNSGLRMSGYQEADISKIVKSITKYSLTITEPEKIKYHLEKAFYLMLNGRPGPVWLDIPFDVQSAKIDETKLIGFDPKEMIIEEIDQKDLKEKVSQTLKLLKNAKRPVLILGNGIRLSKSMDELDSLLKKLKIPLLTTWGAIDFIEEDHPLFFGRPNILGGNRAASFIMQNSDVLLTIGARLGVQTIGYKHEAFARNSKHIMVDIDENELNKNKLNPYLKINSSAKNFIDLLNIEIKEELVCDQEWINWCKIRKDKYPIILPEYSKEKNNVNVYAFLEILSKELSSEDIISPSSSGSAYVLTSQAFKIKKGQRFLTSRSVASMGWGLASSIGACIASGGKRTICIEGDGSIQMNLQELQTIISKNLPIKIFVLNNGGYLTIKNTQESFFKGNYVGSNKESSLFLPNLTKIAKANGFHTEEIKNNSELNEKIKKVLEMKGPVFCEIFMNPNQKVIPKLAAKIKSDGTIIPLPIEDLTPLLDREEFKKNMIIAPLEE